MKNGVQFANFDSDGNILRNERAKKGENTWLEDLVCDGDCSKEQGDGVTDEINGHSLELALN